MVCLRGFQRRTPLNPKDAEAEAAKASLAQALAELRAGHLVVIPTETVYGLAADAENSAAVNKIFALKGRPATRPLIVHVPSLDHLDRWVSQIPAYAYDLAQAFWPGPLSLVLRRSTRVPDAVTGGQDSVALRVPAHALTLDLLRAFNGGVAAPSANRYGRISPTKPAHVQAQFGKQTPYIVDGGPCRGGIESTIVSCLGTQPLILRPGMITAAQVAATTGLAVAEQHHATSQLRTAGQDITHYAPQTKTILFQRERNAPWPEMKDLQVGFLGFAPPPEKVHLALQLPSEPTLAAQRLYAALHKLDAAALDLIVLEAAPEGSQWDGIRDRLLRASGRGRP